MTITFIRDNKTGAIRCRVHHPSLPADKTNQRRITYTVPKMFVPKQYWLRGRIAPTAPGAKEGQDKLDTLYANLETYLNECGIKGEEADKQQVKKIIAGKGLSNDFWDLYTAFTAEGNGKGRRDAGRLVKRFTASTRYNLKLSTLTLRFYKEFNQWRIQEGITDNAFKTNITHIKVFCNWLKRMKRDVPEDHEMWEIPKPRPRPRVDLTREQIETICAIPCPQKLEKIQGLFWFQYLTGMRYVDTQETTVTIKGGTISFIPKKTRNSTRVRVEQDITPELAECIRNNNMKHERHAPKVSIRIYNQGLKALGRLAGYTDPVTFYRDIGKAVPETRPFCDWLSSHDARHSAANHLVRDGVSLEDVAQFLGDKESTVANTYYNKESAITKAASRKRIAKIRKAQ